MPVVQTSEIAVDMSVFSTKAGTLDYLAPILTTATVLPLFRFATVDWCRDQTQILDDLAGKSWANGLLIVRSSAAAEDGEAASLAGKFLSIAGVSLASVDRAINDVIASYGDNATALDEVLIQPMLKNVALSGVAFSHDPNTGAPYIIINYELEGDTSAVTGGRGSSLRTRYHWRSERVEPPQGPLAEIIALVEEITSLTGDAAVDIEFAIDRSGRVFLFQARPLIIAPLVTETAREQEHRLTAIVDRVRRANRPHPYLHGRRTVFGVMPDWNPAEIIGTRPRPLALSLYRQIITDSIWAYQRHNYGYKNLRSFPLLVSFEGLPYIDVRVSFNSFIPADIEGSLADRLVDHYIDGLAKAPHLHDKVEFEIVHSCYTFDLPNRIRALKDAGFADAEIETLTLSLKSLTNRIIDRDTGLCRLDLDRVETLRARRETILASDLDDVSKIYWLLEDCKRYGTLPFAGLARGGFIAMQMLRSLVAVGIFDEQELAMFMSGIDTVSARMGRDLRTLDRPSFLERYGHLRPGTYDILSPRYDEAPDFYFPGAPDHDNVADDARAAPAFRLSLSQLRAISDLLLEHGLTNDVVGLFDFFETGIRGREYAKFVFSHSLSDALLLLRRLGERLGHSVDELSYMDIQCVYDAYITNQNIGDVLAASIATGKERHARTRQISLPPLIVDGSDVWSFELSPGEPNFITQKRCVGPVVTVERPDAMAGGIVMITSADPGFDWIFHRQIKGFVTAYGGVNSHMAIRASELGIPAVIGAGDVLFRRWSAAKSLEIDAANHLVRILR